jgi:hypothetical protein
MTGDAFGRKETFKSLALKFPDREPILLCNSDELCLIPTRMKQLRLGTRRYSGNDSPTSGEVT